MARLWTMSHGINWNWFALVELHDDGTATVLREGRLHLSDPRQGRNLVDAYHKAAGASTYEIVEPRVEFGVPRIATGVRVNGKEYPLREPVGRFSFPGLTREPEEV